MTSRRTPAGGKPTLSASRYPTLESFFSGYLHEDFVVDHGSPQGALRAFETDASQEERRAFDREASALLDATATLPFETVADFVRRGLGAAWRPANVRELEHLLRLPSHGTDRRKPARR
jgi:hypothetical protein